MYCSQLQLIPDFFSFSPLAGDYRCIFPTQKSCRCGCRVNMMDRQRAGALRERITVLNPFQDDIIDQLLETYAGLCCCMRFHRASVSEHCLLQALCKRWLRELQTAYQPRTHTIYRSSAMTAKTRAVDVHETVNIATIPVTTDTRDSETDPGTRLELHSTGAREVKTEANERLSQPISQRLTTEETLGGSYCPTYIVSRKFEERVPARSPSPRPRASNSEPSGNNDNNIVLSSSRPQTRSQTHSLPWAFKPFSQNPSVTITTTLLRDLTSSESPHGSIYIFSRRSDPGILKIGYTIRSVAQRLREWRSSCNYIPELVYSVCDVPHVKKVERLVQLALGAWRRKETHCKHNRLYCPRSHQEWFEISVADAKSAVDGWAKWMRAASPYGCEGVLKQEWRARLLALQRCADVGTLELLLLTAGASGRDELEIPRHEPSSSSASQRRQGALVSAAPARKPPTQDTEMTPPQHSTSIASPGALALWKRAMALTRCTIRISNVGAAPCSPWTIASALWQDPNLVVRHEVNRRARGRSCEGVEAAAAAEEEEDGKRGTLLRA